MLLELRCPSAASRNRVSAASCFSVKYKNQLPIDLQYVRDCCFWSRIGIQISFALLHKNFDCLRIALVPSCLRVRFFFDRIGPRQKGGPLTKAQAANVSREPTARARPLPPLVQHRDPDEFYSSPQGFDCPRVSFVPLRLHVRFVVDRSSARRADSRVSTSWLG